MREWSVDAVENGRGAIIIAETFSLDGLSF
jgi:hypothetical protein